MALDERFIPLTSLNEYFVNKSTGKPLANGKLKFFRDTARNTPKPVYELVKSGGVYTYKPLNNTVALNGVGTAQDSSGNNVLIYAFPYEGKPEDSDLDIDLYYIVAEDSAGNVQWTREAIPNLTSSNDPVSEGEGGSNELANPQFSRYFLINDTQTLSVSATNTIYPIAPDWDLVASGSGNVTVQRVPVAGNDTIVTFPAYYLSVNVGTGVTNVRLRQRLRKNSGLWSGRFVSGFFVAKVGSGEKVITMKYIDNGDETVIFDATATQDWDNYGNTVQLSDSTNTQSGEDAHIDIEIDIPDGNTTDITSLQVLESSVQLFGDIQPFDARSANRDQALMGDYYIPRLEYKNIPSLLVGWDFVKNPRQFGASGSVSGGTAEYIWDQTILQTDTGLTVNYGVNAKTNGLSLNHQQADKSYALIQYLDGEDAQKCIGTRLSVNINGYTVAGGNSAQDTEVQIKMFANASDSQFDTLPTTLVNIASNGTISLTSTASGNGWYEITRSNLPVAKGHLHPLSPTGDIAKDNDLGFNNWVIDDNSQVNAGVKGFAIVVSFVPAASVADYETQIDSISVTPGDIPTRPVPVPFQQVLEACEAYYEKSYESGVNVGTVTKAGEIHKNQTFHFAFGTRNDVFRESFSVDFKTAKRAHPTMTFYSPTSSTENRVIIQINKGSSQPSASKPNPSVQNISTFAQHQISNKNVVYFSNNTKSIMTLDAGNVADEKLMRFHYVADARIGN